LQTESENVTKVAKHWRPVSGEDLKVTDRLDIVLVNKGLAKSREKAKALIKDGKVYINNIMQTKASASVDDSIEIEIRGELERYVSRGGYKLEKAVNEFALDLDGLVCIDIGASTGGFTDCMLQNGASLVYAVDVGHDQLDDSLRQDQRVISMEGVNFRYLEEEDIEVKPHFGTCDVSFISLTYILPVAYKILDQKGSMVCLIKPQFEAGKEHINKKGVVKDKKIHVKVLREILQFAQDTGFFVRNLTFSPIKGPEGNIEYLMYITKDSKTDGVFVNAANTVSEAFNG